MEYMIDLNSPKGYVIMLAVATATWLLKVVWDVVVPLLRSRGKSEVAKAAEAAEKAHQTPALDDDKLAELALERAKLKQDFLEKLADALDKNRPAGPKI